MKLIDADAIPWDVDGVGFVPVIGKDEIDEMPESVVRCKDCAHSSERELFPEDSRWKCKMAMGDEYHDGDFFCAWGERREEG